MQNFEDIKAVVKMKDLLENYGIYPTRGSNIYLCPFHQDRNPSANIIKGCEKFHCFREGKTWDVIDFVMEMEKCDYNTAIKVLDKMFGLGLKSEYTEMERLEIEKRKEERELRKKRKEAWESFEQRVIVYITKKVKFWEEVEKTTHLTKKEYKENSWQLENLFFFSLKRQEWLNWLFNTINEIPHDPCSFDYIYPTEKIKLLSAISRKKIKI